MQIVNETRLCPLRGFPGGSVVKNPPAARETQAMWVRSLSWEDPLEKEMAAHSGILAWKIPWTEKPGRLQSMGSQRVILRLLSFFFTVGLIFFFISKIYS